MLFFLFLFQKAKSNCLCLRCFFSHWNGFLNFSSLVALFCGAILKTEKAVLLTVHMLVVFNMEEDKDGLKSRFLIGEIKSVKVSDWMILIANENGRSFVKFGYLVEESLDFGQLLEASSLPFLKL